jgi:hypothetical protein
MAIFDVPQRFSRKWVAEKVATMDSTEFHAMFHEAATRGWSEQPGVEVRENSWATGTNPAVNNLYLRIVAGSSPLIRTLDARPDGGPRLRSPGTARGRL